MLELLAIALLAGYASYKVLGKASATASATTQTVKTPAQLSSGLSLPKTNAQGGPLTFIHLPAAVQMAIVKGAQEIKAKKDAAAKLAALEHGAAKTEQANHAAKAKAAIANKLVSAEHAGAQAKTSAAQTTARLKLLAMFEAPNAATVKNAAIQLKTAQGVAAQYWQGVYDGQFYTLAEMEAAAGAPELKNYWAGMAAYFGMAPTLNAAIITSLQSTDVIGQERGRWVSLAVGDPYFAAGAPGAVTMGWPNGAVLGS